MNRFSRLILLPGSLVAAVLVAFGFAASATKFDPVALKAAKVSTVAVADDAAAPCSNGGNGRVDIA